MKVFVVVALFLSTTLGAGAQTATPSPEPPRPVPSVHHAVSTDARAQAAFDRGLLDYYAYNPEAAQHEFYTAADLDAHLAMAYWGMALTNAPNLNVPATDDRGQQARYAIRRAKALERYASPEDRGFIDAAAARFDDTSKASPQTLLANYRNALRRIALAYPNDPDAAALYAESALYVAAGDALDRFDALTPAQRAAFTARIAALLPIFQAGLAKFPKHIGLLHFYIHAAQMAGNSQAAVAAATQLAAFQFPPEDSHLTHMPGHTFFDVGMYDAALDVGQRSVAMDLADFACCHPGFYSATRYYHHHNVSFELYALTQTGHLSEAIAVARRAGDPAFVAKQLVAARDWKGVLAVPYTAKKDGVIAFSRGLAYAELGDAALAKKALAEIPDAPADSPSAMARTDAMRLTLSAEIALLGHDDAKALHLLAAGSAAAHKGDTLGAAEMPALYFYSPNMALAELATKLGQLHLAKSALEAELTASPRSPAALHALSQLAP